MDGTPYAVFTQLSGGLSNFSFFFTGATAIVVSLVTSISSLSSAILQASLETRLMGARAKLE